MNKVVLIGRLTKDPELRYTPGNGIAVSSLTVAVDNYNSKTGEKGADFIPVVVWGKSAENVAQYCVKGSQIAVSGRIANRSYDAKDGTKRYITEVVADMFNGITFLSSNNSSGKNNNYSQSDFGTPVEQEEELPF
jgi:single-strand DNA-binding protein